MNEYACKATGKGWKPTQQMEKQLVLEEGGRETHIAGVLFLQNAIYSLCDKREMKEWVEGIRKEERRGGKEEEGEDLFIFLIVVKHTHHKTPMLTFLLSLLVVLCWASILPLQPAASFRGSIFIWMHSQSPECLHFMRLSMCSGNNAHCLLLLVPGSHPSTF